MKHALPTLFLLSLSLSACGQHVADTDVPAPVRSAFAAQFPKAQGTKWEMEDKKDYEANFSQKGVKWSAVYNATGTWMETEQVLKTEELPEAVRKTITAQYADQTLKKAERSDTPSGTTYEVKFKKGDHEMEVIFSTDGTVVKTEIEDEEGEKDNNDDHD